LNRAGIFIDHGYLQKVLEAYGKWHMDYLDFCEKLTEGEITIFRNYVYDCMPYQSDPPTEAEKRYYSGKQKFFTALNRMPRFEVRFGKLQKLPDPSSLTGHKFVQKRVDVLMAVDIVRMTTGNQISRVILVAGDSDLVPAVVSAKNAGAEVYLWYARTGNCFVHDELLEACDERRELTREFIESVKIHGT
jgi:uncharacterized LabA/DUF88 family protein